nr:hypothetical protein [uncultured Brevundimonas sp.]
MYSIFISHSGVSWETLARASATQSGSSIWLALIAVPKGAGAMDFSGGTLGGDGSAEAKRSQAASARGAARIARRLKSSLEERSGTGEGDREAVEGATSDSI